MMEQPAQFKPSPKHCLGAGEEAAGVREGSSSWSVGQNFSFKRSETGYTGPNNTAARRSLTPKSGRMVSSGLDFLWRMVWPPKEQVSGRRASVSVLYQTHCLVIKRGWKLYDLPFRVTKWGANIKIWIASKDRFKMTLSSPHAFFGGIWSSGSWIELRACSFSLGQKAEVWWQQGHLEGVPEIEQSRCVGCIW